MGFISAPGPLELVVVLVIALIVLGPKRLPETARSIGKGMREMRDALSGRRRRRRGRRGRGRGPRPTDPQLAAYQKLARSSVPSASSSSIVFE